MDVPRLCAIVEESTVLLRKRPEEVTTERVGDVTITTVFAMPAATDRPDLAQVDLHFVMVGVAMPVALARRAELETLLAAYPEPDRLAGGPSYIELGGVLGDQGLALRLMGLGEALDLWQVITPARLGATGDDAERMAGAGFVMISGWRP